MKTILELSHIKARQYFLESQNYCNMQFPKYIDFKPVIEYVQNSVGNKELRDILKDPKRMPSDYVFITIEQPKLIRNIRV